MTHDHHPLLERLLHKAGATADAQPSPEAWRALLAYLSRTYHDADQDRYTLERSIDISSREMQGLYQELQRRTANELAALRQSDERHRLLFDSNPIPIWVFDAETHRFLAINDAMVQLYGYSRDELLAMRVTDVKIPEEAHELAGAIRDRPLGHVVNVGVRKHRRKDGTILEMDISSHMIRFDGRSAVLAIAIDRTEGRRLEEQLRQAQKMDAIGQLAGGIAHDFNNILAVIMGSADLARELIGEHPAAVELVEIEEAAQRAAALTQQLLAFSRKQPRKVRPLALNAIVTGIEPMLTRLVGEDVLISTLLAPALGTIEGDAGQCEQILLNLVVNARDAMPSGGRLIIETSNASVGEAEALRLGVAAGRYVSLAVRDTGCGMSASTRARIFEPFFTTKEVHKGTGLGLSTVFGIVKQSGGAIAVDSKVDHGTTFRIYLPRIDSAIASEAVAPRFVPARGTGTILVVEDDEQVRRVLHRYLTSWGYTLLQAPNGVAALDLVRAHEGPIDLLLTDLVMPEMDGRSLSRQLLADRPATAVVFMSGYTEHAALKHAALGPGDHFVQKPFTVQELSEMVHLAMTSHP